MLSQPVNRGKGAALRTGFAEAREQFVAVQDADPKYDPLELKELLGPLLEGRPDVVYGCRFLRGGRPHRVLYFWHSLGNRFLTVVSNMFTGSNLTDMETCKVFRLSVIQAIEIEENRVGLEPEVTAKLAQRRLRIDKMGILYSGGPTRRERRSAGATV